MFAVIRTGGKQYRVAPNDVIEIEKVAGKPGDIIELSEVILLGGDGGPKTGSPTIAGALVAAEVIEPWGGGKWHMEIFRSVSPEPEDWNGEM